MSLFLKDEEIQVGLSREYIIYQIIRMRSGSSGSRLGLGHGNLKVQTAFVAYPVSCKRQLWRLSACGANSMKIEKEVHTMCSTRPSLRSI